MYLLAWMESTPSVEIVAMASSVKVDFVSANPVLQISWQMRQNRESDVAACKPLSPHLLPGLGLDPAGGVNAVSGSPDAPERVIRQGMLQDPYPVYGGSPDSHNGRSKTWPPNCGFSGIDRARHY